MSIDYVVDRNLEGGTLYCHRADGGAFDWREGDTMRFPDDDGWRVCNVTGIDADASGVMPCDVLRHEHVYPGTIVQRIPAER